MQDRNDLSDPEEYPDPESDAPGHDAIVTFAVFFEGGLAPLSLVLGWWFGHAPLNHFGWDPAAVLTGALAAFPPALFFVVMLRRPIGPFARVKRFCEEEFVPLLANSSWADLVLIAVSAGVGEEMLFRGVFQATIADATNEVWGLVLASLLFGALHPISLPYSLISFTMGMYLGVLYLVSENLLAPMICHGVYDFILMAYLLRTVDPDQPKRNPIDAIDADHRIDEHDAP